jgi:membrane associated rhomboid family serine protease
MTYAIIGFTVLISMLALRDRKVFESMMFEPFVINTRKDWFRLVTHGFIHGNVQHLAVNMFVLFMFGPKVEEGLGELTGRSGLLPFMILYLAGITLSSLPGYYKHRWDPTYRAVGASGATSAVVFASILMNPLTRMLFPPGPAWLAGLLYLGYEWFMSKRGNDGIAHDAHFAGALVGIVFTALLDPPVLSRFVEAVSGSFS